MLPSCVASPPKIARRRVADDFDAFFLDPDTDDLDDDFLLLP